MKIFVISELGRNLHHNFKVVKLFLVYHFSALKILVNQELSLSYQELSQKNIATCTRLLIQGYFNTKTRDSGRT